jgi:hypothetical protein
MPDGKLCILGECVDLNRTWKTSLFSNLWFSPAHILIIRLSVVNNLIEILKFQIPKHTKIVGRPKISGTQTY